MKNINIKALAFCCIAGFAFFISCKKKFDLPPAAAAPGVSGYITIDSIYKKYLAYYVTSTVTPTKLYKFNTDVNVECTVTADETSGNIYKMVYVADATGGLQVKLINKGGLAVGDKIRINLNGVTLDDYGSVVQLDSLDITKHVVKLSSGNTVTPKKVTMNQIKTLNNGLSIVQSQLIQLDSVEFDDASKAQTYAYSDMNNKYSRDLIIRDASGNTITLRSSGYSNFANNITPCGKGSLVAIAGQYNSTYQLTLRTVNDVMINAGTCPAQIKDFNDNSITSGGWTNYNVNGSINWVIGSYNGETYAQISNYVGGTKYNCETWLISPPFDLSNSSNPYFSFTSAYNYTGSNTLEVKVSTDYVSGVPTSTNVTWTTLTPTLSPGSWTWVGSGIMSLTAYKSPNTRIAFKYTGTTSTSAQWEIDNIVIYK